MTLLTIKGEGEACRDKVQSANKSANKSEALLQRHWPWRIVIGLNFLQ